MKPQREPNILIIDGEPAFSKSLQNILEDKRGTVYSAIGWHG